MSSPAQFSWQTMVISLTALSEAEYKGLATFRSARASTQESFKFRMTRFVCEGVQVTVAVVVLVCCSSCLLTTVSVSVVCVPVKDLTFSCCLNSTWRDCSTSGPPACGVCRSTVNAVQEQCSRTQSISDLPR